MKNLVLILVLTFCVASIWAEGETTEKTMDPTAATFVAGVTTFANANYSTDKAAELIDQITTIANRVQAVEPVTEEKDVDGKVTKEGKEGYDPSSQFDPAAFMAGVNVQMELAASAGLDNNKCVEIKASFLLELSFLLKGYVQDMEFGGILNGDAKIQLTNAQYLADVAALVSSTKNDIVYQLNPPAEDSNSQSAKYKPEEYLDVVFGEKSAKRSGMKLDFYWGGNGNKWLGKSMKHLMNEFKRYFANDSDCQADLESLTDIWPQGAEVLTMESTYKVPDSNFDTDENGRPNQAKSEEYCVSEYGNLAYGKEAKDGKIDKKDDTKYENLSTEEKAYYDKQFKNITSSSTRRETNTISNAWNSAGSTSYNNRSWSGVPDGTYNTIKLTTNGREYTMQQHFFTSPLVFDMDGDGNLEASKGEWMYHTYNGAKVVEFDMDGDGFLDISEWVGPNDGLLMVNANTTEVSANELFGNAGGYLDGYEKLSLLDKNKNGKIEGNELSTLSVWQDKNGNAKIDSGEVSAVSALGITSINVKADSNSVSSFEQNGATKKVWDWYPIVYTVKRTR